ncbi:MAG: hypothetical protein H6619_02240 [Deltaproteobacteria bacterium]|nr:hypothetical protein [Deltaproteobacteria bacterium]
MIEIENLSRTADKLLAHEELSDEYLELLFSFTEDMQTLIDQLASTKLDQSSAEKLKDLYDKHALVLEQSKSARDGFFSNMKELEKRGKAIKRYVDNLPKRISRMGVKKG